jgi:hypothetical protein
MRLDLDIEKTTSTPIKTKVSIYRVERETYTLLTNSMLSSQT